MYFVDNGSAVPVMPQVKPVSSATPQFFTEGGNGTPPTYPGPDWFNIFQLELLNVLKEAQINPDKANHTQLVTAMKKLFLDASSNGSDIPDKAAFLSNLGLGAGAPAIGIPFFWPSAAMPNTVMTEWSDMVFLKFNGATFSASAYPKLALAFPGLALPEARGEFPRIWDDGRGVDTGRALLSAQDFALQNITGRLLSRGIATLPAGAITETYGAFNRTFATGSPYNQITGTGASVASDEVAFDASRVAKTATETRPRNIAFNFLVRAK